MRWIEISFFILCLVRMALICIQVVSVIQAHLAAGMPAVAAAAAAAAAAARFMHRTKGGGGGDDLVNICDKKDQVSAG
jgi:hypothetical protein